MTLRASALVLFVTSLAASGCAAVYPRYTTVVRDAPPGLAEGGELTPPPDTVHRLGVVRADVPRATRDGRSWDGGDGPDPYIVVLRNGAEILRSRTIENSFAPRWEPARDYVDAHIRDTDALRVELRDDDALTSELIGLVELRGVPTEARNGGIWMIRLEGGATVQLSSNPPPARLGMGVTYEYHADSLAVVRVEQAGPGYNAGLREGDRIAAINGRAVSAMSELEVRDAMDRAAVTETTLAVTRAGARTDVTVRRDALYPAR